MYYELVNSIRALNNDIQNASNYEIDTSGYHQGYNIGRSGKKYTAEELNMLIRE